MNKLVLMLVGFLLISSGVLTGVYILINKAEEKSAEYPFEEKLKLSEELLNQSSKKSASKALLFYTEILSKKIPESFKFRTSYGHALALQKNKDKLRALEIFKELNQLQTISKDEKEKLSYSLGSLLLQLNQEEEGRAHIDFVLQNSKNNQLRSKTFQAIADNFLRQMKIENASKNYLLAIQEYPNNLQARIGWMRTIKKLGKEVDIFEDYSELEKTNSPKSQIKESIKMPVKEKSISYEKAKTYFNKKEYAKAIKAFSKILKKTTDGLTKERIYYYISESNYRLGNYDKALIYADKILINEPVNLDRNAHYLKGLSYYSQKKFDKASASFNTVVDKYEASSITENAKAYSIESLKLFKDEVNGITKDSKETKNPSKTPSEPKEEDELEEDTSSP